MADYKTELARADALQREADQVRAKAHEARMAELRAKPILERLIFAAHERCACGAGMAYDQTDPGDGPFKGPTKWECSAILRFKALPAERQELVKDAAHTRPLPFAFYEVKSENQPSANGATTRPEEL